MACIMAPSIPTDFGCSMPKAYSTPATLDATTLGVELSMVQSLTGRRISKLRAGPFVEPSQVLVDVATGDSMAFPNQAVT